MLRLFIMPPISLQKKVSFTAKVCANAFFDQRCNELERWLHKRGYSERFVSQKILNARKMPRNELLEKECNHQEENKLMFNIPSYPAFQNINRFHTETNITS